ncbi:hypothetical protein E3N88_10267 [Mikania micrantha]|uniref:Tf2-1-like SH3-like domain-containing protein n=1 Tax=Mikania micrantha TaxID=192012 RepID=A0A5N6PD01_9ASTR|nr:hypothetical protein E3N88_10267 [Mikania micrantha]
MASFGRMDKASFDLLPSLDIRPPYSFANYSPFDHFYALATPFAALPSFGQDMAIRAFIRPRIHSWAMLATRPTPILPTLFWDRQKSFADRRRKPLEFQVGDRVLLKVSPWKSVVRFGKKGKLASRYVGPFEILERIGPIAYKLKLPVELSIVHDTFHVSNLKKCLADHDVQIPLEDIQIQNNMQFIERPVEIMDHGVKKLKRSRIPIIKVRWEGKHGAEFTWERDDQMKLKYPHLFTVSSAS